MPEWEDDQRLAFEKDVLGFYVSGHPLARYRRHVEALDVTSSGELAAKAAGSPVRLIGHVIELKETTTKRGNQMAFLTLEDMEGTVEVTVFPEPFKAAASRLRSREPVLIRGRLDDSDKGRVVLAEEVRALDEVLREPTRRPRGEGSSACLSPPHPRGRGRRRAERAGASVRRARRAGAPVRARAPGRTGGGPPEPGLSRERRLRPSWPPWRRSWARARSSWTMPDQLDFEQPLLELETRLAELRARDEPRRAGDEIARLEERLARLQARIYGNLTAWQRTQVGRHPRRPHARDFFRLLFEDFLELHGDRLYGDDPAIVGGLARFDGRSVVAIGHQKGRDTREKIARNFGMPHPEGYRKALRLMQLAEKFGKPILTFIDTPGAYPGIGGRGARPGRGHRAQPPGDGGAAHAHRDRGDGRGGQRGRAGHRRWATACSCSSTRCTRSSRPRGARPSCGAMPPGPRRRRS